MRAALWGSYYGGWFEIAMHGIIPAAFEYDINSAYPYIIQSLPCPVHGTWISEKPPEGFTTKLPPLPDGASRAVHARVSGSNPYLGAMLHRTQDNKILRPHNTSGWYWQHELEAAQRTGLIDTIVYDEWHTYQSPAICPEGCSPRPLAGIGDLYQKRLDVGKNMIEGLTLKTVYNSAYGKTAQILGNPKYSNRLWASLITAGCRTMILEAIATHPDRTSAVAAIATGGIYFTSEHPSLPLSDTELGLWDVKRKENLTLFKPGTYWDDTTREAICQGGDIPAFKSRGVSARYMKDHLARIDAAFRSWRPGNDNEFPKASFELPFSMITPKQAVTWSKSPAQTEELAGYTAVLRNPKLERSYLRSKWFLCGLVTVRDVTVNSSPHDERQLCSLASTPAKPTITIAPTAWTMTWRKRYGVQPSTTSASWTRTTILPSPSHTTRPFRSVRIRPATRTPKV